jgi:ankyrin repeat protein
MFYTILRYAEISDNKYPRNSVFCLFQSGKKQIVTLLLDHGADPTKRNKHKQVKRFLLK